MPKITFIQPDGAEKVVEAAPGASIMRIAKDNNVNGILADCGGECACSTCHVYIGEAWSGKIPPPRDNESIMFGFLEDRQPTSRLCCQVRVSPDMDGMTIRVPSTQLQP